MLNVTVVARRKTSESPAKAATERSKGESVREGAEPAKLRLTDRKREDILRAASEAFRHDGFRGSSAEDIAERAGVSKRTLYNHFASKDVLFDAVIESYWLRLTSQIEASADPSLPIEDRIVSLTLSRLSVLIDPEVLGFFRAILGESMRTAELTRAWGHGVDALSLLGLTAFVLEEKARGRLAFESAETAASQLWGLCLDPLFWPSVLLLRARIDRAERERVAREGAKTFLARYGVTPSEPPDVRPTKTPTQRKKL